MYDTVLTATDGSRGAETAVEEAIATAALYNADLHVVYVVDAESYPKATAIEETVEAIVDELGKEGERIVSRFADRAAEKHVSNVTTAVEKGAPAEAILAYADEVEADIIVLGTHGQSGSQEVHLGSVAETVARRTDLPLLLC